MADVWRQILRREKKTVQLKRVAYLVVCTLRCGHAIEKIPSQEPRGSLLRCPACEQGEDPLTPAELATLTCEGCGGELDRKDYARLSPRLKSRIRVLCAACEEREVREYRVNKGSAGQQYTGFSRNLYHGDPEH